ncbi:MAG: lipoyl(octanoyl) transferase LipB [Bacteroidetes bacterium]|nr:lipoyl(octanoyl) transferase LipB [Bacteroidota bacterium]
MQQIIYKDLGLIDYKAAWDLQEKLHAEIVSRKIENRKTPGSSPPIPGYLLFCEHPHVYTLGRSGDEKNLLVDDDALKTIDATFYKNNRGGDITYHGPGQLVGYPILDLDCFFTDIHKYLRFLEEAIILTLKEYGIESGRIPGLTGVWLDTEENNKARKICAFGVRCSRWVTMHGFAFNVNTDLSYFGNIVPCGITDKAVTSMEKELGRKIDLSQVKELVKKHLCELFDFKLTDSISSPALL